MKIKTNQVIYLVIFVFFVKHLDEEVPPLVNLTVIAIDHFDPTIDMVSNNTVISAFVADLSSEFGTARIGSALTGPDGVAILSVPHNRTIIITATRDENLANSITIKANLNQSKWIIHQMR